MANKRQLKKHVQAVCGELATELLITRHLFDDLDNEKVNKIITEIAILQETTIANCTFALDKACKDLESRHDFNQARNSYYHKAFHHLIDEFNKGVIEIVKHMNEALPADVKKQFKAAVNRK